MDLASREIRNLTNAPGGDFRPSWSPDGQTIAFSSDRDTGFPHQDYPGPAGKWEHVQAAGVYVIDIDGTGLRKLTTAPEMMAGSPQWSADGSTIVFYEMLVRATVSAHFGGGSSSIVSVDVATGERTVHASGPGLKVSPQFIGPDRIAYLIKTRSSGTLAFTSGEKSAPEDRANPSWSRDGDRVVYHAGQLETMHHYSNTAGRRLLGTVAKPGFELVHASGWPAVSPDGRTLVVSERTPSADRMALVLWDVDGTNPRRVYQDDVTVMGLEWSRDGRWLTFGAGAFFLGRSRQPAEIMIMKADGSEVRAVTSGPGNAGFPSWSSDGTEIVYRYWTGNERGEGLRIVDVATGKSRVLTTEYDTLPFWSPRGDVIMFTRYAPDDRFPYDEFDIYTIRPDGTDLTRLTDAEGNDAHSLWSPDGNFILFSSSRFGLQGRVAARPQPAAAEPPRDLAGPGRIDIDPDVLDSPLPVGKAVLVRGTGRQPRVLRADGARSWRCGTRGRPRRHPGHPVLIRDSLFWPARTCILDSIRAGGSLGAVGWIRFAGAINCFCPSATGGSGSRAGASPRRGSRRRTSA